MNAVLILKLSALTYAGLIAAGLLMPRIVGLPRHVAALPKFIHQLFWVYYGFIGFCLVSFGVGTFFFAGDLASGTPLARALCGFLGLFWTLRLLVGAFVFELEPYLINPWRRCGLAAANFVFGCLPLVYGWVALKGGN